MMRGPHPLSWPPLRRGIVKRLCVLAILAIAAATPLRGQTFVLGDSDLADSSLPRTVTRLAHAVETTFRTRNLDSALDVRFRIALVTGRYAEAARALFELRQRRSARPGTPVERRAMDVQYAIYAAAKATEAPPTQFGQVFASAFRKMMLALDDRQAAIVLRAIAVPPRYQKADLDDAVAAIRGKRSSTLSEALRVVRAFQSFQSYSEFAPFVAPLIAEDDERRYIIERNVPVRMSDGATVCVMIVRPRRAPARLPALLEYTIYADTAGTFRESRRTASNQYVAVTGFTRGKLCSPQNVVPYVYDGKDAAEAIDWIAKQPWSDGRVGMYSGSYEGFTQWAAVKHMPKALRAIMAGATNGPGIDTPMEGNIFWNFIYSWPFYTTDNKTLDDQTYGQRARWERLNQTWYVSGSAYRDLDKIDGVPNPIFDEWLRHPTYDAYWQALIPYAEDFSRVNIPVLETAGYYYGGPGAVFYYFTQHYKYNPRAEHYLVIGPYDHLQAQRGVVNALGDTATQLAGLTIDPVARMSIISDLRYAWFDYVFKGKAKPALLADKVNFEVVGSNVWRHAPSVSGMSNAQLRYYLSSRKSSVGYALISSRSATDSGTTLVVNMADRSDSTRAPIGGGVVDTVIDTSNALVFVSDPLSRPTEVAGVFSGHLEFVVNKRDFDLRIGFFEETAKNEYVQLPPFQARASLLMDQSRRQLSMPNEPQHLDFSSVRLIGQRLHKGSRLVMVLGIVKNNGQQINYGTGKDVSDETIADAGEPLRIHWLPGSFVLLPIRH